MGKSIILATTLILMISSCATILNGPYQKVIINTENSDQVLINNEELDKKDGKYLLKRDNEAKRITLKNEGYEDRNLVIVQYRKSPLHILSWVPGIILIYPPLYDWGRKAWNYDKEITFGPKKLIKSREPNSKEIQINKVSVEVDSENIKFRIFESYRNYLRNKESGASFNQKTQEDIKIENTVFPVILNELLKDRGYIDTTRKALKNSYLNNLLINATIKNFTIGHVSQGLSSFLLGYTPFRGPSIVLSDLTIEWEVLDFYENTVYSKITKSTSDQFAVANKEEFAEKLQQSVKDALNHGLVEFLDTEEVITLLNDRSELEKENRFEPIKIPRSDLAVSNLTEATKSSVTITTKSGFGSGFFISSDGYIITNYHVIVGENDLKVILNNKSEYPAEIVRVSKIHDLALLKIDALERPKPFEVYSSKDIEIAMEVYAVGTATAQDLSQTVSRGIVSGIREIDNNSKLIQTDASVNNGNSGGALVSKDGKVIGVVSSKVKGLSVEGVAFGIPAYQIMEALQIVFE